MIKRLGTFFLLGTIIFFGFFGTRSLRRGPELISISPTHDNLIKSPFVTIEGSGEHIAFLFIDNYRIIPTTEGTFEHKTLLHNGKNIVSIDLYDKFENHKKIDLVLWGEF